MQQHFLTAERLDEHTGLALGILPKDDFCWGEEIKIVHMIHSFLLCGIRVACVCCENYTAR